MNTLLNFLMSSKSAVVTGAMWSASHFLVRFRILLPEDVSQRLVNDLKQRLRARDIFGSVILYETDIDYVLIGSADPGLLAQQLKGNSEM